MGARKDGRKVENFPLFSLMFSRGRSCTQEGIRVVACSTTCIGRTTVLSEYVCHSPTYSFTVCYKSGEYCPAIEVSVVVIG